MSGPLPGDVVINEIMWMGSSLSSADEWIELRNMTSSAINLTGWQIEGAGSGSASILLSGSIPAHGFFLLSNYVPTSSALGDTVIVDQSTTDVSLDNNGEVLTLKNGSIVIDKTPAGAWAAGINSTTKHSMERNSIPGDGTLPGSWHSCVSAGCNNSPFWDIHNGTDNATPRATNLSENDPSLSLAFPLVPEIVIEEEVLAPAIQFMLSEDKRAISFTAEHIEQYDTLQYELSYDTDAGTQGAIGIIDVNGQPSISREDILLGTCSTAGVVCTFHTGITTLTLTVRLMEGAVETVITQELTYE